jgi:hypothetical protein
MWIVGVFKRAKQRNRKTLKTVRQRKPFWNKTKVHIERAHHIPENVDLE